MKTEYKIILLSLVFGMLAWTIDAVLDAMFFYEGTFWQLFILDLPGRELYMRVLLLGSFLAFGFILSRLWRRRRRSEQRYRTLIETIPHGIEEIDVSGIITVANPAHHKQYEYGEGELIGMSILDLAATASDREELRDHLKYWLKAQSRPVPYFGRKRTKNGRVIDVQVDWNYKRDIQGQVTGFIAVVTDITERKRAEEAVRQSEQRYRTLFELAPSGVLVANLEGRIVDVNPAVGKTLGYSRQELIDMHVWDLTPDPPETIRNHIAEILKGSEDSHEVVNIRKDGSRCDLVLKETAIQLPDGSDGVLVVSHDITARKRAEQTRMQLAAIVESTDDAIDSVALDGTIMSWNVAAERLFGYSAAEAVGRNIMMLVPPDRTEEAMEMMEGVRHGQMFQNFETVCLRKDGRAFDVSLTVSPVKDEHGNIIGTSGIVRDITERKRTEEALRDSEQRYRNLFERAPISITEEDFTEVGRWLDELRADGVRDLKAYLAANPQAVQHALSLVRVLDANEAALEMFEARDKAELFAGFPAIFKDETYETFAQELIAIWEGRNQFECECQASTLKGNHLDAILRWFAPVVSGRLDLSRMIVAITDVTARKRAEVALRHSEEHYRVAAESNRRLLHEVNHRVRNNLASLLSLISLIRKNVDQVEDFAAAIESRLKAMSQVHSLLVEAGWQDIHLCTLVNSLIASAHATAAHKIDVIVDGAPTPISPRQAVPLAMSLTELFTNSCKHGAHRSATGRVRIAWQTTRRDGNAWVRLAWRESGGPEVKSPVTPSLGTELIEGFVNFELGGRCQLRYPPSGADHVIEFALDQTYRADPPVQADKAPAVNRLGI